MGAVVFYSNYSDKKVVDKILQPFPYGVNNIVPCDIYAPCDDVEPHIIIDVPIDINDVNYMYLSDFKAYYFIKTKITRGENLLEIVGEKDRLYTFREGIRKLKCVIERNEYKFSGKIPDTMIVSRIDRKIQKKKIGTVGGTADGTHIALTTTGGLS